MVGKGTMELRTMRGLTSMASTAYTVSVIEAGERQGVLHVVRMVVQCNFSIRQVCLVVLQGI